jgi:RecB family exonuclease
MSEQPALDGMPEKLFSCTPNRLETWLDCPKKYRFTYIDVPKPPRGGPWGHTSMGSAVHNALREWFTLDSPARTQESGAQLVAKHWRNEGFRDDEQSERYKFRAQNWVRTYLSHVDPNFEPRGLERTVSTTTEHLALSGRVDRIDERDGELVIVDYKTGKHPPDEADVGGSLALAIYALAAERTLRKPCRTVELHHLPSDTQVSYRHNDQSLARHIKRAEAIAIEARSAVAGDNFPATPGALCGYCDYARICTDADRAPAQPWAGLDEA